jgi:hypothetical protein
MSNAAYNRAWRLAHPGRAAATAAKYNKAHPDRNKKWVKEHPEQVRVKAKAWRDAHPEKGRAQQINYKFGITVDDYSRLFTKQGGRCAICGRPETATRGGKTKWLAVDHDHETGKVRGLLCQTCNSALGLLNDDITLLLSARDYLLQHRKGNEET